MTPDPAALDALIERLEEIRRSSRTDGITKLSTALDRLDLIERFSLAALNTLKAMRQQP